MALSRQKMSHTLRFALLAFLATHQFCSAGTVPNRATGAVDSSLLGGNSKKSGRVMHSAFQQAGQVKGLEVWRVENFEPVLVPARDHGKFFTGDSYIVLNTKESKKKVLSWDVHFWLGLETTQDEAGAAAILTVQLDDLLNGGPVQHREVQDHESQLFLGYFKNGVRYESGGVSSGFHHVTTNAQGEKRLFQVKGKRNIRVRQVGLSVSSMNKGDCFILDAGNEIFVYVGMNAKRLEKIKAISAANQIRDQDHHGRAAVQILDEFSSVADQEEFFKKLGSGSADTVPEEAVGGDDGEFETKDAAAVMLYKVSDSAGSLKVDPISTKPFRQDMLKTEDCFILDTGSGIYAWIGKGATQQEKTKAMERAQEFIKTKKYPAWTEVHRLIEGGETAPFKQYFSTWRDRGMTHSRIIRAANDNDSDTAEDDEDFDPSVLHALKKSGGRALGFMPDNGGGEIKVWRIEDFELTEVDPSMYGMFFGGDCYLISYKYANKRGGNGDILYYWLGKQSTTSEQAAAAMQTVQMDKSMNDSALQVRVVQGHEPRHFLKIFEGKLIIFHGGHASSFNTIQDNDTYDVEGTRLFRVRGTCIEDVRAEQMPLVAASLASDDTYILETPQNTYIWYGKGASQFEKEMAQNVSEKVAPNHHTEVIQESEEPEEFWNAIGGIGDYDKEIDRPGPPILDARLFHCHIDRSQYLRVVEVNNFEQDDLDVDDIMVMDGGDEIYVWEGSGSTEEEKEKSLRMAKHYIRTDPSNRSEDTVPIVKVREGHEPRSFKRLFPTWDDDFWQSISSYEQIKSNVAESNNALNL